MARAISALVTEESTWSRLPLMGVVSRQNWKSSEGSLSSGQEAADKLPAGKGIQHGVIGMDIAGGELVQDHHHINVAGFCGLPAAVAPLESGKPDAVRKGLIQGSHIFFNKFSYFNHFR